MQLKVGDRVRHREEDKTGEVYGVHPESVWVLWEGSRIPQNTMPNNAEPLPFAEGDYVVHRVITSRTVYGVGEVLAVADGCLWVSFEKTVTQPVTVKQGDVERTKARRLQDVPKTFKAQALVSPKDRAQSWTVGTVTAQEGEWCWVRLVGGNSYVSVKSDQLILG